MMGLISEMTLNFIFPRHRRVTDGVRSRLFHGRPQAAICIQPYFPLPVWMAVFR